MHTLTSLFEPLLGNPKLLSALRAAVVLVSALLFARLAASAATAALARASRQHLMLGRRLAFYLVFGLGVVAALDELGFNLHTLLGAAGVATVAVGFAAQTSTSNFIAGLFLITERPFVIGDVIRIGGTTGEVLSIDLLSVKLRTYDNLYVRVPNESVVKSEVVNLSYFPIRRVDLAINLAQATDLERARALMFELAHAQPLCLEEPKPTLYIQAFADGALQLQFSVWVARPNFFELKSAMLEQIRDAFVAAGVESALPGRSVNLQAVQKPVPVTLVEGTHDPRAPGKS